MLLQVLAQGFAQDAHTAAVNYADAGESGQEGTVDEFLDFGGGVVDGTSDDVDFVGDGLGFGFERHRDAAGTGSLDGGVSGVGEDFGDIVARDFHFHHSDFNFEVVIVDLARNFGGASDGLELDGIAFGNVLDHLGLGVGVSDVGAGGVGDYRGVELVAEFAAQFGDAALGFF